MHAALAADATLELVAPTDALPAATLQHLRWTAGVRRWRVGHPEYASCGATFERWDDVPAALRAADAGGGDADAAVLLRESMFPPAEDGAPLDRSVRLLPTDDDCGGFFVAVLRRAAVVETADGGGGEAAAAAAARTWSARGIDSSGFSSCVLCMW